MTNEETKSCATCGNTYTIDNPGPGLSTHLRDNPNHQCWCPRKDQVHVDSPGTHELNE